MLNCASADCSISPYSPFLSLQEDFAGIRDTYIRNGEGFMCVFSLDSLESFRAMDDYYEAVLRVHSDTIPLILVGNKSDVLPRKVNAADVVAKAARWNVPYIECSAKTNQNVEKAFLDLVRAIAALKPEHTPHRPGCLGCTLL
eukprot:m.56588 g.56588  ORF g.56588 m.56588 type:complete len:143 (-) comp12044_c0_seq1:107-535(-)